MDAANIDFKAFSDSFYHRWCGGRLEPVLETLHFVRHHTDTWLELTTLLIPGENDSDDELRAMTRWVVDELGPDVPMHFTAFHPAWKMLDKPPTPARTLRRARRIALENGVRYAFTGNVRDEAGGSTYCHQCGRRLIGRDGYHITDWNLADDGRCRVCDARCAGVFDGRPGGWGARRASVRFR
jgi:pyruvate formate lyase activating enzyme